MTVVTSKYFTDAASNEEEINQELVAQVRHMMGPIASFRTAAAITALPRTRSGKIIRKSIALLARSRQVKVRNKHNKNNMIFLNYVCTCSRIRTKTYLILNVFFVYCLANNGFL